MHFRSGFVDRDSCEQLGLGDHSGFFVFPDVDKYVGRMASKPRHRALSEEDCEALKRLSEFASRNREQLIIYDVSRLWDKIISIRYGIRKTPAAIINGEEHEGLEKILQRLSR